MRFQNRILRYICDMLGAFGNVNLKCKLAEGEPSHDFRIRVPRINSERYRVVNCPLRLDYKMKLFIFMNK